MWDVPSYRIRAYLRAIKNPVATRKRTQQVMHCKRVDAEIRVHDGIGTPSIFIPARIVLNELTAKSLRIYCDRPLYAGQKISISMKAPRSMYLRGEVRYCQNVSFNSRVITDTPFHYRLGIEFTFSTLTEEEAVTEFSEQIRSEELNSVRVLKDV